MTFIVRTIRTKYMNILRGQKVAVLYMVISDNIQQPLQRGNYSSQNTITVGIRLFDAKLRMKEP